jgi:hypothetical protein
MTSSTANHKPYSKPNNRVQGGALIGAPLTREYEKITAAKKRKTIL